MPIILQGNNLFDLKIFIGIGLKAVLDNVSRLIFEFCKTALVDTRQIFQSKRNIIQNKWYHEQHRPSFPSLLCRAVKIGG